MSVSVEVLEKLKRKAHIKVDQEKVASVYTKHLNTAKKQGKIDGFRPGKAPNDVIEKKFGGYLREQTMQEIIEESFREAVEKENLNIAGQPAIEPGEFNKDAGFEYVIKFETYPEIELADLTKVKVEKSSVELNDKDTDSMLQNMQKQHAEWEDVEKAAEKGDQIVIDFVGTIDGEEFSNNAAQDFSLELGLGRMIPGFEEGILGMKPNEEKVIKVTFPKDYPSEDVADKKAEFTITAKSVKQAKLPELNEEFAKKLGKDSVDAVRAEVKETMLREVDRMLRQRLKKDVLDKLLESNTIDVPDALVETEIKSLQRQSLGQNQDPKTVKEEDLPPREQFIDRARERVTLGLLLGEVIKLNELKATEDQVRERILEMAVGYNEPEKMVEWYFNNPHSKQMLAEIESVVLEDAAVDKLLEQMQVTDKTLTYDDVVNPKDKK